MATALEGAFQALQAGQLAAAESTCRSLIAAGAADAKPWQLLGIVLHRGGRLDEAETALARAVALAPRSAEIRTNRALLMSARGQSEQALAELERALTLEPRLRAARLALSRLCNESRKYAAAAVHARKLIAANEKDSEAWSALGTALFGTRRNAEARQAFERAAALSPDYGAARYNLATVLCEEERAEEALAQANAARRLGVDHRELSLTRAKALIQLDRFDEAEKELLATLAPRPDDVDCQFLLAQLRHIRGDSDFARGFREAAQQTGAALYLRAAHAATLQQGGDLAGAERLLRELLQESGSDPRVLTPLGLLLQEQGRPAEAAGFARVAAAVRPDDAGAAENLVSALLSMGEARETLPIIERFRTAWPHDLRWVTYRADAARQLNEGLFGEWCDVEHLVRVYDLEPPAGFHSIDEFHAALRPELESRHRQASHPLHQSMRNGTQSSRGLLADSSPAVAAFLKAVEAPIAAYQRDVGRDPAHPLLGRNAGPARLIGCWSVRLRRSGFHVNHIHPRGWLSSAYYVSVPAEAADPGLRGGWIKFGEPRFAAPHATPRRFVQPKPGRLVLFPSYLWHGTVPLRDDETRLTVAFDAVPAP